MKFCECDYQIKQDGKVVNFYYASAKIPEIIYLPMWRMFCQLYNKRDNSEICFCPRCGTKFPHELGDEWYEILQEEYGIEDPMDEDAHRLPEEFKTDEWWKKRGL